MLSYRDGKCSGRVHGGGVQLMWGLGKTPEHRAVGLFLTWAYVGQESKLSPGAIEVNPLFLQALTSQKQRKSAEACSVSGSGGALRIAGDQARVVSGIPIHTCVLSQHHPERGSHPLVTYVTSYVTDSRLTQSQGTFSLLPPLGIPVSTQQGNPQN